ncbi:hypothetical protein LCM08_20855 [Salipiger pacificus]|nr:hypothetical protein [Alloyangia pacifica]
MPKDNATNDIAQIGHNGGPVDIDPIDAALAPYGDSIEEAQNWLDGTKVENEEQMKAVDKILAEIRQCSSDLANAEKEACGPLHKAWKEEKARWKPSIDDIERIKKGLASLGNGFKQMLAKQKAEEQRKAREEADRKRREAEEAARAAQEGDIESQRAAAAAQEEARAAQKASAEASREKVRGLRTVTRHAIDDHRAALHWIAQNDRDAMTAFIEEYVRRNHRDRSIDGVRVWTEKESF